MAIAYHHMGEVFYEDPPDFNSAAPSSLARQTTYVARLAKMLSMNSRSDFMELQETMSGGDDLHQIELDMVSLECDLSTSSGILAGELEYTFQSLCAVSVLPRGPQCMATSNIKTNCSFAGVDKYGTSWLGKYIKFAVDPGANVALQVSE